MLVMNLTCVFQSERQALVVSRQVVRVAMKVVGGRQPNSLMEAWKNEDEIWDTFFQPLLDEYKQYLEVKGKIMYHPQM